MLLSKQSIRKAHRNTSGTVSVGPMSGCIAFSGGVGGGGASSCGGPPTRMPRLPLVLVRWGFGALVDGLALLGEVLVPPKPLPAMHTTRMDLQRCIIARGGCAEFVTKQPRACRDAVGLGECARPQRMQHHRSLFAVCITIGQGWLSVNQFDLRFHATPLVARCSTAQSTPPQHARHEGC